jgi:hypothetical protein
MDWLNEWKKTQALRDKYGDAVLDDEQGMPLEYSPMKDEDDPEISWASSTNNERVKKAQVNLVKRAWQRAKDPIKAFQNKTKVGWGTQSLGRQ